MAAGEFQTRQAVPEDADAIALAHLDSIRSIGPKFYSPDIVELGRGDAYLMSGQSMPCVFMRKVLT